MLLLWAIIPGEKAVRVLGAGQSCRAAQKAMRPLAAWRTLLSYYLPLPLRLKLRRWLPGAKGKGRGLPSLEAFLQIPLSPLPLTFPPVVVFPGESHPLLHQLPGQGWPVLVLTTQGEPNRQPLPPVPPKAPWTVRLFGGGGATPKGKELAAFLQKLQRQWALPGGGVLWASREPWRVLAQEVAQREGWKLFPAKGTPPAATCVHTLAQQLAELFPLVSVVVVAYGRQEYTRACLASLVAYTSYPRWELVVVDNGGGVRAQALWGEFSAGRSNTHLLSNPVNVGFPRACNQGASAARGEYLCFLNNDTLLTPGWLEPLVAELEKDPGVGLVAPVSNGVANEARVRGSYQDWAGLLCFAAERARRYRGKAFPLFMAAFACVLVRQQTWEALGGLDEGYSPGLFEDDDFCFRLRRRGFTLRCRADAYVHHFQGSSFALLPPPDYVALYEKNRQRFQKRRKNKSL